MMQYLAIALEAIMNHQLGGTGNESLNTHIMAPKEPTRAQLSSRLAYSQNTPSFLLKLQNRIAGNPDEDEDYNDEFEYDGSGRPPIPRRPAIPERPEDDPGSADEDNGDEKPQVVVLKEGKHLTEREAENIRRKGRLQSLMCWITFQVYRNCREGTCSSC
jgi:Domain of unknown function (DUF4604)